MLPTLLLLACSPTKGGDTALTPGTGHGLLPIRVTHNLGDDACLADDSCDLELLQEGDPTEWLDELGQLSDMPVLHWDQGVPWEVFDGDPQGDRVAYYDARLDPALLAWIDGFAAHFEGADDGYLALSLLDGSRDRLAALRDVGDDLHFPDACPDLGAPMQTPGGTSLDPTRAWTNFTLYMVDKLEPRYLALGVELDLFRDGCPDQWDGLVGLYRDVYDDVRPQVDDDVVIFATLTYAGLLDTDADSCNQLAWGSCDQPAPDPVEQLDVSACYPLDTTAMDDLAQGDRLELLALSFYPDALLMEVPGTQDDVIQAFPADWDGEDQSCWMQARTSPLLDPFAQLDRLGWSGPIAIAELSARSCRTMTIVGEGDEAVIVRLPGDDGSQGFWMDRALQTATEHDMPFVVWSFARDYDPLGIWLWQQGVLDAWTYSVFNTWPCSGLEGADGAPNPEVYDRWMEALGG